MSNRRKQRHYKGFSYAFIHFRKPYFRIFLFFIVGASYAALGASLPVFALHFGLEEPDSTLIVAYNLGALLSVGTIAIGGLKLPPKRTFMVLLALFCLGSALMSLSASWNFFIFSSVIAGTGYGGMVLLINTACAQGFGEKSVIIVNWLNATFGLGAICGPIFVGVLGAENILLLSLSTSIAAVAGVFSIQIVKILENTKPQSDEANKFRIQPVIVLFLIAGGLYGGLETSIGAWFSTSLTALNWEINAASSGVSYFWLGITIGRFVIPIFTRNFQPSIVIVGYFSTASILLLLATFTDGVIYLYPLAGFAMSPILSTMFTWAASFTSHPQRLTALLVIGAMMCNTTLPGLIGYTSSTDSAMSISISLLGISLVATLIAFFAHKISLAEAK